MEDVNSYREVAVIYIYFCNERTCEIELSKSQDFEIADEREFIYFWIYFFLKIIYNLAAGYIDEIDKLHEYLDKLVSEQMDITFDSFERLNLQDEMCLQDNVNTRDDFVVATYIYDKNDEPGVLTHFSNFENSMIIVYSCLAFFQYVFIRISHREELVKYLKESTKDILDKIKKFRSEITRLDFPDFLKWPKFNFNKYKNKENDSFIFCDKCGQKLPRRANYCLHCSFDLTQNNQEDPESDEEFDNPYDNHHENGKEIEVIPKKSDTKSKKWRPEVSILIFIISFLLIFIATSERDPEGAIVNGLVGGFFWTLVLTHFFGYKK